jgi:hypothetical protein
VIVHRARDGIWSAESVYSSMRRSHIVFTWLAVLVIGAVVTFRAAPPAAGLMAAGAGADFPEPNITPDLPISVPKPQMGHEPFDWFAWQVFVALNWPAALDAKGIPIRGRANTSASIGDPGPRVWQTYKADWELYGDGKQMPAPTAWSSWTAGAGMSPCPASGTGPQPTVAMVTKMDSVVEGVNQARSGPLIDQRGKFVRYEIRFDQSSYESIVKNQWFLLSKLANPIEFSGGAGKVPGATIVKAAWRELTANDDESRFFTTTASIVEPGPKPSCRQAKLGLVGFHITVKTSPFREWVWATFEHEDNVPDGGIQPGRSYSFHNGQAAPDTQPNGYFYPVNCPPANPSCDEARTKNPAPIDITRPLPTLPPVQVTRVTPIDPQIASMNAAFHAKLAKTVWRHYNLVADQWPTQPGTFKPEGTYPGDAGVPFPPEKVANTTAETYFQKKAATHPLGDSCMKCHYQAAATDFSWTVAMRAFDDTAVPVPTAAAAATESAASAATSSAMKAVVQKRARLLEKLTTGVKQ